MMTSLLLLLAQLIPGTAPCNCAELPLSAACVVTCREKAEAAPTVAELLQMYVKREEERLEYMRSSQERLFHGKGYVFIGELAGDVVRHPGTPMKPLDPYQTQFGYAGFVAWENDGNGKKWNPNILYVWLHDGTGIMVNRQTGLTKRCAKPGPPRWSKVVCADPEWEDPR
jgi:hypothetical protein